MFEMFVGRPEVNISQHRPTLARETIYEGYVNGFAKGVGNYVRFQVLTAASMKFRIVFWDVLPCKIIVDRRFRDTCCLHHQAF
jgi:hypothetical protein